jgi:hypothetical protein
MAAFRDEVSRVCAGHSTTIPVAGAISIRNIVLKDKIVSSYGRMNGLMSVIAPRYASGESILSLARVFDFPPLNLLRGILLHRGMNPSEVYQVFAEKVRPALILSGRDLSQYKRAAANDAESIINQQAIADIAAANEDTVVQYFQRLGIGLKTQADLTAEQLAEHGRAVITPDILFTDEVYINDQRVHWIDYKDYIGTYVPFLYNSNVAQAAKYTARWGPGAMLYHHSFIDTLKIPGAILLDTSALGLRLKDVK